MKTRAMIFLTAAALAAPCFANPSDASVDNARAVEQAVAQFYTSLNAIFSGDASLMKQLWSHADDVTYMGPVGGFQVGWERVQAVWDGQATMKLGGRIVPHESRITVAGDMACVQCYEQGENLVLQGRPLKVSIRATSLFRKENGEWKMISHHTDLLPRLEKQLEKRSATTPAKQTAPAK